MTIWRSADTWRRVAQKQLRRSQAAVATRNWRVATVANQRAQVAIERAAVASELTPKDEQVLASLHYDLTELHTPSEPGTSRPLRTRRTRWSGSPGSGRCGLCNRGGWPMSTAGPPVTTSRSAASH
jgi:hypothetical protein